jgi:hypothetical protein
MKLEKIIEEEKTEFTCEVGGGCYERYRGKDIPYCPYLAMESVKAIDCGYLGEPVWEKDGVTLAQCRSGGTKIPIKAYKVKLGAVKK